MLTVERVKITKVPQGEAPLSVREKWVGLVLPCIGKSASALEEGVLSHDLLPLKETLLVPQKEAIKELQKSSPEAAAWWNSKGFPKPAGVFTFGEDEGEIIGAN